MYNHTRENPVYTVLYASVFALAIAVIARLAYLPSGYRQFAFAGTVLAVAVVFALSFRLMTNARLLTGRTSGSNRNK